MGFSEKRRFVRHLCPDIAVIPECSQASIQSPAGDEFDCRWFGENPKVEVGKYREWAKVSDHVPLMVDVALGQK